MTASRIILAVYDLPSVASAPCRVCGGRGTVADELTPGVVMYEPCEECDGIGSTIAVEAEGDEKCKSFV